MDTSDLWPLDICSHCYFIEDNMKNKLPIYYIAGGDLA